MYKKDLTTKQAEHIYRQVVTDDTYWDDMTADELEKRIDVYKDDSENYDKLITLLSCMRLAEIVYLRRKENRVWTMPVIDHPDGQIFMFFTSEEQILSESCKPYKKETAHLPELLESVDADSNAMILLNPDTQYLLLPLKIISDFFHLFDDVVMMTDEKMEKGIKSEDLDDVTFEHFFLRKIECEMMDGSKITGEAFMYKKTKKLGSFLFIDDGKEDSTVVYKNQVKFIKDVTVVE